MPREMVSRDAGADRNAGYVFSSDWFSDNIPVWREHLACLLGTPGLRILEVGSFEGRSACWLLQNILVDDTDRLDCVDRFGDRYSAIFDHNVRTAGGAAKIRKLAGLSQEVLRTLTLYSFDAAYIDGSHTAPDVLEDVVLVFRLLKPGGILILDDYEWHDAGDTLLEPRIAVDAFLDVFAGKYDLLHREYQIIVRKA